MKVILVFATVLILAAATLVNGQCYCGSYSQPVCGSNMITYTNRCYMSCARVQLAYPGPCRGYGGLYGGGYGGGYGGYGTGYGNGYGSYGNLYRPTASILG